MADSRRELVLKAIVTALSVASVTKNTEATTKPAGLAVHRHLTRMEGEADLPDITVFQAGLNPNDKVTDLNSPELLVRLRCRVKAAAGISGDEALDPILVWAELALMDDYTLGGVSAYIGSPDMDAISAREYADTFAEATLQFPITYETKWGDPRQAP